MITTTFSILKKQPCADMLVLTKVGYAESCKPAYVLAGFYLSNV